MVRLDEILQKINLICPNSIQEDFDNSGLQVGDREKQINKVLLALDFNQAVLDEAITVGAELIISHHPFMFQGIKSIDRSTYKGRLIFELIGNDVALLSLHTNFDKVNYGVSRILGDAIGLADMKILIPDADDDQVGLGVYGDLPKFMVIEDVSDIIKEKLSLRTLKYVGDPDLMVKRIALIGGSGASLMESAKAVGADLFISGDFKYHDGQKAYEIGLPIIDATHFATEVLAMDVLQCKLHSILGDNVKLVLSKRQRDYFDII